jgi:hypothetical protein
LRAEVLSAKGQHDQADGDFLGGYPMWTCIRWIGGQKGFSVLPKSARVFSLTAYEIGAREGDSPAEPTVLPGDFDIAVVVFFRGVSAPMLEVRAWIEL